MAPYIGQSKVLMHLEPHVASGLLANGTVVKVPKGASKGQIDAAWERKFGKVELEEPAGEDSIPAGGELERPRGNGSREDWAAYALANGFTEDDLAGKKQSEIRALFDKSDEEEAKVKEEAEAKAKADAEAKAAAEAKVQADAEKNAKANADGDNK